MMKRNKVALLLILVFVTALLGGCSGADKVGVVDVSKVMTDSPKVKKFQDDFNVKGKETIEALEKEKAESMMKIAGALSGALAGAADLAE